MLIDLTCPAEVFQVSLPTEEHPAAECSLYSLSDRIIVSADVTLKLQNDRGVDLEKVTVTIGPLNARPHIVLPGSAFPARPIPERRRPLFPLDRMRFSDRSVWEPEDEKETEYKPNDLPVSKALTDLKFAAGETAKGFPSQQDGLWVCVCGRPNPDSETSCVRCRQKKETVFARFNRDAVETKVSQREKQLALATRSTREDLARPAADPGGGIPRGRDPAEAAEPPARMPGCLPRAGCPVLLPGGARPPAPAARGSGTPDRNHSRNHGG